MTRRRPQSAAIGPDVNDVRSSASSDVAMMLAGKQRYRDVSPVTLQLVGGVVSSSLYCGEVEGLLGLVESFMVELYRCKLCQFTCGLKASISSHLQVRHRLQTLTYLGEGGEGGAAGDREEGGVRQRASPYHFDLNGESKQSNEDEDFLLYNMLDNMSPPTCDIGSEGVLQVAHTCEVNTLFEESSSMFPPQEASVDLSCPLDPGGAQEETAQSAHLMTLGLCRISAAKAPHRAPACSSPPRPPAEDPSSSLKPSGTDPQRTKLPCPLCPLILPSRRLLDVHVRSHRAAGDFGCVCCSWTADSWEELERHWRSHSRRRREEPGGKRKVAASRQLGCPVCLRRFRSAALRKAHQQTHSGYNRRRHSNHSDGWRSCPTGRAGEKDDEFSDSQTSRLLTGPLPSFAEKRKKSRRDEGEAKKKSSDAGFCCSLCHRKFSSKLTLRRHLGTHEGEKPFSCPHCSYSSRLKASLQQHLRTHTGEKPYRCTECSYASIDRSSLLRHRRTHSQEKPYSCQHCDYSSIQKKSLDLHARRHHTGEAFPCRQCDYSSPDRQLLVRHISRHHACGLTGDQAL
nr:zinc finger protein 2 isoform X1 [Gasterosteus aculeatus aculeatus]XP_040027347.1 zinc finger protein 2 isoform X1 [Gasterosteus aculeatus aculeatus]